MQFLGSMLPPGSKLICQFYGLSQLCVILYIRDDIDYTLLGIAQLCSLWLCRVSNN